MDHKDLTRKIRALESELAEERQQKELQLRKADKFRDLVDNASDLIHSIHPEDGSFIYVNNAWLNTLKYSREEVSRMTLLDIVDPAKADQSYQNFQQLISGHELGPFRTTFITKLGHPVIVEGHVSCRFKDGKPVATRCIFRDITAQQRAEEVSQRSHIELQQIFNLAANSMCVINRDHVILRANNAFLTLYGKQREEIEGRTCYKVLENCRCRTSRCPLAQIMNGTQLVENEFEINSPSLGLRNCTLAATPYYGPDNELIGIIEDINDITERKKAAAKTQKSLREKELLLREIHHRVKNNMQVISSLLYIQSGSLKDPQAREYFHETQQRIRSMAMIHDSFYHSMDLDNVDFHGYVTKLISDRWRTCEINPDVVKNKIGIKDIRLPIDKAIPCGLLVNELVTNALNHAFPDGSEGTISITASPIDRLGNMDITVSDDGVGLPLNQDIDNPATFGLLLVSVLIEQINGELTVNRDNGTSFSIRFNTRP